MNCSVLHILLYPDLITLCQRGIRSKGGGESLAVYQGPEVLAEGFI